MATSCGHEWLLQMVEIVWFEPSIGRCRDLEQRRLESLEEIISLTECYAHSRER